jgi:hypothetical protein
MEIIRRTAPRGVQTTITHRPSSDVADQGRVIRNIGKTGAKALLVVVHR